MDVIDTKAPEASAPIVTAEMVEAAMPHWCGGDPEFEPREDIVARILAAGISKMGLVPLGEEKGCCE
jgi:hypothetical protein